MRLTFLGKETQGGGSPTLFATDRDTYVVQGWRVPGEQTSVEIPKKLLSHLEGRAKLAATLHDTERDSYILSGRAVTDATALSQMNIPGHETSVEVDKARESDTNGTPAG